MQTLYTDLQSAVNAASPGATIQTSGYCPGVSARGGLTQTLYVSKSLTIRGDLLPDFTPPMSNTEMVRTVLDAQGSGRALVILGDSELITVTLDGLRLTQGDAAGLGYGEPDSGGTPTDGAGGLLVEDAVVTLRGCDITDNTAEGGDGFDDCCRRRRSHRWRRGHLHHHRQRPQHDAAVRDTVRGHHLHAASSRARAGLPLSAATGPIWP